ncbi:MAG TPA: sigma factor-like helix-turn-helix DNA-binding protein [Tepidisphaeraceae bacterium]|nr:sigma factor-like helix-turn-helix DNA-binding protein [Tepidisphaeraceae bacterium]
MRDRVRSRANHAANEAEALQAGSGEALPVDVLARQESLQAALNELDQQHKMPFLLVFLEGMTCQEAADMLDMPLGTVLSRIHRARQLLRARLGERDDAPPLKLHRPPQEHERNAEAGGTA